MVFAASSPKDGEPVTDFGEEETLILEATRGQPIDLVVDLRRAAGAEEIAAAFENRWPRLVFVSGYEMERSPDWGELAFLSEALVRMGAPAVLGWPLPGVILTSESQPPPDSLTLLPARPWTRAWPRLDGT